MMQPMSAHPPEGDLSVAAVAAMRRGNKIEAIKIVRAESGLGLKEAKDVVDAYERIHPAARDESPLMHGDSNSGRTWWLVIAAVAVLAAGYLFFRH